MNKNKVIILIFVVVIVVVVSIVVYSIYTNEKKHLGKYDLSKEEIMEDLDFLNKALSNNFPYYSTLEDKYNFTWENELSSLFEKHFHEEKTYSIIYFNKILSKFFNKFNFYGHLSMAPYELVVSRYNHYYENVTNGDKFKIKNSVTNKYIKSSDTMDIYSHIAGKDLLTEPDTTLYENYVKNNLNLEILNDSFGYIKVKSFFNENLEEDSDKIKNFYQILKEKKIETLIIDVKGNTGGTDIYWIENFVIPNMQNDLEYTNTYKGINNSLIKKFAKEKGLININFSEDNNFIIFETNQKIIKEGNYENDFNIFVIADDDIFSSTTNFTYFCKQTNFATIMSQSEIPSSIGFDPMWDRLPNSKLFFIYDLVVPLNDKGDLLEEVGLSPGIYLESDDIDSVIKVIEGID